MTVEPRGDDVVRLLTEIRDIQREHLALRREAVRNQAESIRMQTEAVRMQRQAVTRAVPALMVVFVLLLVYLFVIG